MQAVKGVWFDAVAFELVRNEKSGDAHRHVTRMVTCMFLCTNLSLCDCSVSIATPS
jgi:hypothetical protein